MTQETDVHVARHPIFDTSLNVFGYELLFRNSVLTNAYSATDDDQATLATITNSFLSIGLETLTHGKRAFINFTANALRNNLPAILPVNLIAVEILENVLPTDEIIAACQALKKNNYLLVLDDFSFRTELLPLIELADIIKVDFRATPSGERHQLISRLKCYPVKFLAEKVETHEEFQEALREGYSYFQGYFFCRPLILSGKTLPGYKMNYLHILQQLHKPEIEISQIEAIVKQDVSLSYDLLKYINSSVFGLRDKVRSLRQALTLLGQKELIKWLSLISLKSVNKGKPGELIVSSLIRAQFAESLALRTTLKNREDDAFLMGMLSHIDALLNLPLAKALDEIGINEEIRRALLNETNSPLSELYRLIRAYEEGNWKDFSTHAAILQLDDHQILTAHRQALIWVNTLLMVA